MVQAVWVREKGKTAEMWKKMKKRCECLAGDAIGRKRCSSGTLAQALQSGNARRSTLVVGRPLLRTGLCSGGMHVRLSGFRRATFIEARSSALWCFLELRFQKVSSTRTVGHVREASSRSSCQERYPARWGRRFFLSVAGTLGSSPSGRQAIQNCCPFSGRGRGAPLLVEGPESPAALLLLRA